MDSNAVKNILTDDDITELLVELGSGYPKTSSRNNALMFTTICHGGDSHKLYYYSDTKIFRCYTHCSCNFDIFALIEKVKDVEFFEAYKYVCNKVGIDSRFERTEVTNDNKLHKKMKKEYQRLKEKSKLGIPELPTYDGDFLCVFSKKYPNEWISDGISRQTMALYDIRYEICHNRAIIPTYDFDNRLIGIRCRNFDKETVEDGFKYMPLNYFHRFYTFPTNDVLYGSHIAKKRVGNGIGSLFVFEGEKSCMQLETMYPNKYGSVALFGSSFSDEQARIINKLLKPKSVYLCFDKEYKVYGDSNYMKQKEKIKEISMKLSHCSDVYVIWDKTNLLDYKDSPTDKGIEVFDKLVKNADFIG